MATAAAKRAQMKELESTPPRHVLNESVADKLGAPAKRMLCSAALNAEHTPAKRMQMIHASALKDSRAPRGSHVAGDDDAQQWSQHEIMQDSEYGLDSTFHQAFGAMDTQLPFNPQSEGRVRPLQSPYGDSVHLQTVSSAVPYKGTGVGASGIGRAPSQILNVARPQAQRHPVRREVGNLKSSSRGAIAGLQLRTPSRSNSAGSALRGYVPPEHRFVSSSCDHFTVSSTAMFVVDLVTGSTISSY